MVIIKDVSQLAKVSVAIVELSTIPQTSLITRVKP